MPSEQADNTLFVYGRSFPLSPRVAQILRRIVAVEEAVEKIQRGELSIRWQGERVSEVVTSQLHPLRDAS